ncbi:MAG: ubiquinol-cytochrome c reductase [Lasallia pustulata]|uniref:Cytochrome b-c1 complex subunit 7 n=1 Tax=Lasallia pustulata TaxID=136370 RepID=A0A1W5DDJ4_9LECA|nr:MAG: ubiquinol-cytochrome c reductase [Lasallia pustulata]SLM40929.1 ubiquinol-cytochrome c reductase complex 14 kda protein [Lasallia pustulata]
MSAPSLTKFIIKRPWLNRWMTPLANWYAGAAGYRKLGLRADDLIPEESNTVMLALKRLPPKEAYDRVFRLRRAFQCSLAHQLLPKDQQTKPEEDYPYLTPIIEEIEAESRERDDLEAMVVNKRKAPH